MPEEHLADLKDLSAVGKLQPYKKEAGQHVWKKFVNIPNAIFAVSVILIMIYFFTIPSPEPTISAEAVKSLETAKPKLIEIHYFYENSKDCSRCIEGRAFMEGLKKKYSSINLKMHEMSFDPDNKKLFKEFIENYSVEEPIIIPMIFTNDIYFKDFSNSIGVEIDSYVKNATQSMPN
ncbi:hypothetical protein J4447_01345 [Candidatus Pacearchaeota archaeon]|nr:hypothetical protein [Candidatus Pacearchaeota archaeon]